VLDGNGDAVADLGPGDFTVTVEGQARRVVSATFVPFGPTAAGVPAASAARRLPISTNDDVRRGRLVVFVVDQNTLSQGDVRHVTAAASRLFDRLTPADRSALVLMPVGTGVPFTANHAVVREQMLRASGLESVLGVRSALALSEVRAIASGDFMALSNVASRVCPSEQAGTRAGGSPADAGPGAPGNLPGAGGNAADARGGAAGAGGASAFSATDECTRRLQFEAQSAWHQLHGASLASITSFRYVLTELKKVPGEKTVVLISGGWPLQLREATEQLTPLAGVATDARVTVYTLFAASSEGSAEKQAMTRDPIADESVRRWPLQTLAGMTGAASYGVDVGAAAVFDRLGRELSGYYRLSVEQDPKDTAGRSRPLKVQVGRGGVTTRAPERITPTTYAERDVTARLDAALTSPLPATGVGLRITSYVAADPETSSRLKVLLVLDASGAQPGEATFQLALQDAGGKVVSSSQQALDARNVQGQPFTTSISVDPGRYILRAALMDASGAVGSVDHLLNASRTPVGPVSASDLVLARVPPSAGDPTVFLLDAVRQDEQLVLQLDLEGDPVRVGAADVVFEIAASDAGPALVTVESTRVSGTGAGMAQAIADVRVLPAGEYVARGKVTVDATTAVVLRPFVVTDVPRRAADGLEAPPPGATAVLPPLAGLAGAAPPFTVQQVLAPSFLGPFLDRLAARPDASTPSLRPLLEQLRTAPAGQLDVPAALDAEAPVAAGFVAGVSRLARAELDPAAQSFRASLRASADFYPAMIYLGACFAAGGKDLEAAGAWQTALIKEGDVPALHALLIDALLRLKRTDSAMAAIERARRRWPGEPVFARRFVLAALAGGQRAEALAVVDGLPLTADDEPVLALALQVLYEAVVKGRPIESADADRARLQRYAEAYRRLDGPSLALVDAWVAAADRRR
jgi:VWFA-related protein